MLKARPHLKGVFRTSESDADRRSCMRLDRNENVDGLSADFVRKVLSEIDSTHLATYPIYDGLLTKIAKQNGIRPENLCLANGSDAAIKYIFDAYISPNESVLMTDPTFAMYPVYCSVFSARAISVKYNEEFSLSVDGFVRKLDDGVRMAILVNPNNPTGTGLEHHEILKILQETASREILLLLDEAYYNFSGPSYIPKVTEFKNLIVLRTFSKVCGMAGARIGYAAACPEIIENLHKVKPTYDVNSIAVFIAERLLENPSVMSTAIESIERGRSYLYRHLEESGIEYKAGKGNFVLIKCPGFADDMRRDLRAEGVLVGGGFKQTYLMDFIRVTVGGVESMERFFNVFRSVWDKKCPKNSIPGLRKGKFGDSNG